MTVDLRVSPSLDARRGVAAVFGLLAILAASAALAAFSPAFQVSKTESAVASAGVALAPNGRAVFVWKGNDGTNDRIRLRVRTPNGKLGKIKTISAAGGTASDPAIVMDDAGEAVIAWRRYSPSGIIQVVRLGADGTVGNVEDLSETGAHASAPSLAVDAAGNANVVWSRFDGSNNRVQHRRFEADGTVGPLSTISPAGKDARNPFVTMSGNGKTLVVWEESGTPSRIKGRSISATGMIGPLEIFSKKKQRAERPKAAIHNSGIAVIAWEAFYSGSSFGVQARVRTAAGALKPIKAFTKTGSSEVRVGIGPSSTGLVTWLKSDAETGEAKTLWGRVSRADGTFEGGKKLTPSGRWLLTPRLVMNADGKGALLWARRDTPRPTIEARTRDVDGKLGKVRVLSDSARTVLDPQITISQDGKLAAAWATGVPNSFTYDVIDGTVGP